jgi:hypothetical protein
MTKNIATNRNVVRLLVKSEDAAAHGAFRSLFVLELQNLKSVMHIIECTWNANGLTQD